MVVRRSHQGFQIRSLQVARPTGEDRAASPLELLFDLTFTVAVAQIAAESATRFAAGRIDEVAFPYLAVFFAIWWAWMNFTWFASGYDNDDAQYRITVMVQMAGVLVLAAGVPTALAAGDYRAVTFGYLITRAGLVFQWLRVAVDDPAHRATALRNAGAFSALQLGWVLRLLLPADWVVASVLLLVALETLVPLWAARAGEPSWNAKHIAERYALFVIILLGEGVLAAFSGVQTALRTHGVSPALLVLAAAALLIVFSLWWIYYAQPAEAGLRARRAFSYGWGYAHYPIFASLGALGASLEVAVVATGHRSTVSAELLASAVAVPVAVFLVTVWGVHARLIPGRSLRARVLLPAAVVVMLAPLTAGALGSDGAIVVVAAACVVAVVLAVLDRRPRGA